MNTFICFIRGINVGGNNIIKMAELKAVLEKEGFKNSKTYIQSGNVILKSLKKSNEAVSKDLEKILKKHFQVDTQVVSFSKSEWQKIMQNAPKTWGENPDWKHNILMVIPPQSAKGVEEAVGELKPGIEWAHPGKGVVYQSVSRELFGKSRYSKIPSQKVYKEVTIRNFNTANKLLTLINEQ